MIGLTDPVHGDARRLTYGERKIVDLLGGEHRFTIPEAVARTGFTERALRAMMRRLRDVGIVKCIQAGRPGSPARYRVLPSRGDGFAPVPSGVGERAAL